MIKIVFPEDSDVRVKKAIDILKRDKVCEPVLVTHHENKCSLQAGAQLVATKKADAIIAGATYTTAKVFRTYLDVIGRAQNVRRITSCFMFEKEGAETLFYADCAINDRPDAITLSETAELTGAFVESIGIQSRIAFLSFATHESADTESVLLVRDAVDHFKHNVPHFLSDGPLQYDAALSPAVAKNKCPMSPIGGRANVLIFPNLDAGNTNYKNIRHHGGYTATGPILLGFKFPAHDLSRSCSTDEIVKLAELCARQLSKPE